MKTGTKAAIINASSIVGLIIAALAVPPQTTVRLFLFVCLGTLVLVNATVFLIPKLRKSPEGDQNQKKRVMKDRVITLWVLFLIVIFLSWLLGRGYLH